jgi:glycosyltransferase involved in cell wall biosynthesis
MIGGRNWLCLLISINFGLCLSIDKNKRDVKKTQKISVIIPCAYMHAKHLYQLLTHIEQQTMLPDEVIISLGEAHRVQPQVIKTIENKKWAFPCKLLKSNAINYVSKNRNIGCRHATGDVLVLQDADDLPHPQRIEVIKYFFENYQVDFLMHHFIMANTPKDAANFTKIPDLELISIDWGTDFESMFSQHKFTNGEIAISKDLFSQMQWIESMRRQEDTEFNQRVFKTFKQLLLVEEPLLCYRIYLSAAKKQNL